jgi:hypothetical protein
VLDFVAVLLAPVDPFFCPLLFLLAPIAIVELARGGAGSNGFGNGTGPIWGAADEVPLEEENSTAAEGAVEEI